MIDNTELIKVDELAANYYDALINEGSSDFIKTKIVSIILAAEVVLERDRSFFEQKLVDEVWADITGVDLDSIDVDRQQPRSNDAAVGTSESAAVLQDFLNKQRS